MDRMKKVDKIMGGKDIPYYIDVRIDETRGIIRRENRRKKITKNTFLSVAVSCVIFLGISISNPALAEKIPFLENVINTIKEDNFLSEKVAFIKGVDSKDAKLINEKAISSDVGITVQEAYCDGSNIFISYIIKSNNSKFDNISLIHLNDAVNSGDIRASFDDEKLSIADTISKKVDENTYAVLQYIDLAPFIAKGIDVKDTFELQINISKLRGYESGKGERIVKGNWNYKLNIEKDDSKNIKYEPNLENNRAVLNKIVLTPGTTEVEVDVPKEFGDSAYILAYDDKGNMLDGHTFSYNLKSNIGTLQYKKFTPISKDAEYILVQVVDKSKNNLEVFSEFKVLLK